jgi:DNA-binding protein YbaB
MIFGQFGDMVKQARELQSNLKKVKDELARAKYDGEAGGIKVTVNGEMDILEVKGASANLNSFKDAANKALKLAKDDAAEKLKKATGGISIPGLT